MGAELPFFPGGLGKKDLLEEKKWPGRGGLPACTGFSSLIALGEGES